MIIIRHIQQYRYNLVLIMNYSKHYYILQTKPMIKYHELISFPKMTILIVLESNRNTILLALLSTDFLQDNFSPRKMKAETNDIIMIFFQNY